MSEITGRNVFDFPRCDFLKFSAGFLLALFDYYLNQYQRFPLVELIVAGWAILYFPRLNFECVRILLVCSILVFLSKILIGDFWGAGLATLKVSLLIYCAFSVYLRVKERQTAIWFFVGVVYSYLAISYFVFVFQDPVFVKYVLVDFLPFSIFVYFVSARKYKLAALFTVVSQAFFVIYVEYRSFYLVFGMLLMAIFMRPNVRSKFTQYLYLMPAIYFVSMVYLIVTGDLFYDPTLTTKSNIERATLIYYAYDLLQTFPLLATPEDYFLHTVDMYMSRFGGEELSTTSAHNFYADSLVSYGLIVLATFLYYLVRLSKWLSRYCLDNRSSLLIFSISVSFYSILSLTPVAAQNRIHIICLAALAGIICRGVSFESNARN